MTMDDVASFRDAHAASHPPSDTNNSARKRSGSGDSIASKFPIFRTSGQLSLGEQQAAAGSVKPENASQKPSRALAAALSQQHKTRRRKGSLRTVVLLGRGAAREKRELKPQPQPQPPQLELPHHVTAETFQLHDQQTPVASLQQPVTGKPMVDPASGLGVGLGLSLLDNTPRPAADGFAPSSKAAKPTNPLSYDAQLMSHTISYTSTTDEEDGFTRSLPVPSLSHPNRSSFSSGSESYFRGPSHHGQPPARSIQRRRSTKKQHPKSPLSLQGLAGGSPSLASIDGGYHDYSETEWWGWVVFIVTWLVFIVGMGSCLNVWSWAWDVGSTPYAPPELEDDPTLPIVGYYPALMILTSIMAWVWVIVAWVGMKYFRHAKISGD